MDGRLVITSDDVYGRIQLGLDANSTSLCVVIGKEAGEYTHSSNSYNTFIGTLAGNRIAIEETIGLNSSRGNTCLGALAGRHYTATGNVDYSINIGYKAGNVTCKSRTIILNANETELNALEEDALYISNMRDTKPTSSKLMAYDSTLKEVVVNDAFDIVSNSLKSDTITSSTSSSTMNIGTNLDTGGIMNISDHDATTNVNGFVIFDKNTKHYSRDMVPLSSSFYPREGPMIAFSDPDADGSPANKTLQADSDSVGMTLELIKVHSTDDFIIYGATDVYFCALGALEASKTNLISFTTADTYIRMICPRTPNLWHIVEHY